MHLPGRDIPWKQFLLTIKDEWMADRVDEVAGALTFSLVLALFPFLLFVVSLASLFLDPADAMSLTAELRRVVPGAVADILGERLHALSTGSRPGLLTLSAIAAIWAASGGVRALIAAFNQIYDVVESRSFWKVYWLSVVTTLIAAALSVAATAVAIATPAIAAAVGGPIGTVILWLRFPVAAVLMALVLALLYYYLPDVEQEFKFITPGSVTAVVIWLLMSFGFSVYVANFGRYEVIYGALGGMIVLLLWMWLTSMVVLLGGEINTIIERLSPDGKRAGTRRKGRRAGADSPGAADRESRERALERQGVGCGEPVQQGVLGIAAALIVGVLFGRRLWRAGPEGTGRGPGGPKGGPGSTESRR